MHLRRGLRVEFAKRGGVDAVASSTTSDKEIGRNPLRPLGCGGTGPISSLRLLGDARVDCVGDALIWNPSRSQQVRANL